MKRQLYAYTLIVFGISLAACAPLSLPTPIATTEPTAAPTATPPPPPLSLPMEPIPTKGGPNDPTYPIAELVRLHLSQQLQISYDAITFVNVEAVDWSDSCLGVQRPDVMCLMVITSGYKVILEANGQRYVFHTNRDGSVIVQAEPRLEIGKEASAAYAAARQVVTEKAQVKEDVVVLVSAEAVDWPDSCLGGGQTMQACLDVITPGYRFVFTANGQPYEVHTNADGSRVVLVSVIK